MHNRFVSSFPQNTTYSEIEDDENVLSLEKDAALIQKSLEEESKGNTVIKRELIKARSSSQHKRNALHLAPFVYNISSATLGEAILPSRKHELKKGTTPPTGLLKRPSTHVQEQLPLIYGHLLTPFIGAPEDFYYLLIAQCAKTNRTPLHMVTFSNSDCVMQLLDCIGSKEYGLTQKQKEKIASIKDKWEQTPLLWLIGSFYSGITAKTLSAFGKDIFLKTLQTSNFEKQTPIHIMMAHSLKSRHEKLKLIKETLMPEGKEEHKTDEMNPEKIIRLNQMFQQDENKANPLHLLCKNRSSEVKNDIASLQEVVQILGPKLFTEKMLEKDSDGYTPLQYARSAPGKNLLFLREILKHLDPKKADLHHALCVACEFMPLDREDDTEVFFKELIALYGDQYVDRVLVNDAWGFNPLDYAARSGNTRLFETILEPLDYLQKRTLLLRNAGGIFNLVCRYGDRKMLELLAKGLGPKAFYLQRKACSSLSDLLSDNPNLTKSEFDAVVAEHNSLFEMMDYHITKSTLHRSRNDRRTDPKIIQRRADTIERLKAIKDQKPQWDAKDEFKMDSWFPFFSHQDYYDRSKKMAEAYQENPEQMQEEFKACCSFFNELDNNTYALEILDLTKEEAKAVNEMLFKEVSIVKSVMPVARAEALPLVTAMPLGDMAPPVYVESGTESAEVVALQQVIDVLEASRREIPGLLPRLYSHALTVTSGVEPSEPPPPRYEPVVVGGVQWDIPESARLPLTSSSSSSSTTGALLTRFGGVGSEAKTELEPEFSRQPPPVTMEPTRITSTLLVPASGSSSSHAVDWDGLLSQMPSVPARALPSAPPSEHEEEVSAPRRGVLMSSVL